MASRETQVDVTVLIGGAPKARVTNISECALMMGRPNARISQLSVVVLQPQPNPIVKQPLEFTTP